MKLKDLFEIALTNIRHRNLRSWLTILGIVIGVAAIISLLSVSLGMQKNINDMTSTLRANVITITSGSGKAMRMPSGGMFAGSHGGQGSFQNTESEDNGITFREAEMLSTLPGVYKLDAQIEKRADVSYKNKNSSLNIIGTEPGSFKDSVGVELGDGRYLNTNDKYSAVVGYRVMDSVFEEPDILNKQINIDGITFRVVGYLAESGGMGSSDSNMYIPQDTARDLFDQQEDASQIVVIARDGQDVDQVAERLKSELAALHNLDEENADFTITTSTSMQSTVSSISETLSLFLGGIASISLLVGGIGVLNTMFMSVLEQTKMIGVFKSLGAKNRDIIMLFLFEAGILGFIGGFIGVLLSLLLSLALSAMGVPVMLSAELVLLGLLFSVIVGLVAGIAPARNAASISPVEALRYE